MEFIEIYYLDTNLRVYESGVVSRQIRGACRYGKIGDWILSHGSMRKDGRYRINISNKTVFIHRLVAYAYLGLDITDSKIQIDHINRDPSDNRVCNLRLVTNQQNSFNQKANGYSKHTSGKYQAYIKVNGVSEYLGLFLTPEEAHNKYLEAKETRHII